MPSTRTIEVSDSIYEKLQTLTRRLNTESVNTALEKLLEQFDKQHIHTHILGDRRVAPSTVKVVKRDYFWVDIVVGEDPDVEHIALNNIQYEKLCNTGLLPSTLCSK
jgi:predicted CopG family antitoxin